ncbi:hypothetical protein D3C77_486370 [compost metagenome]
MDGANAEQVGIAQRTAAPGQIALAVRQWFGADDGIHTALPTQCLTGKFSQVQVTMTGKIRHQQRIFRQVPAQQPLLALCLLLLTGRCATTVVRQQLAGIEHEQIDARVIMHEQSREGAIDVCLCRCAHARLPSGGDAQLEGSGRPCGDAQLRRSQARQGLGAGLTGIEHEHQAQALDLLDTTGCHKQPLNQ